MIQNENETDAYCKINNILKENLSDLDNKVIKSIENYKNNYKKELDARKCTVLLEKPPSSFENKKEKSLVQEQDPCAKKKKEQTHSEPETVVQYCTATTMKGMQCKCKAKPNVLFCGKHIPKS
tara:strand:+ start:160 stop:528 length:369 start_codon:yes stop_codon:yes gene_type:complete